MKTGECWDLKNLSDDELLKGLQLIICNERRGIARIIAHLAEVEERRLHLKVGNPSLFDYCLRRLALSEGEAFRRVTAARLARRFPLILQMIADGDIHLSAVCELRDYLTGDNHRELLEEASRKTRKQVRELVVRRFPKPDVTSSIRPLPAPVSVKSENLQLPPAKEVPAPPPARASMPTPRPSPPPIVEPLREDRYRLQLSASAELKRKLDLARDLTSHSNPSGDFAVIVERALDLLIDKLERERLGRTPRPRTNAEANPHSRRVSNATKREVIERDGLQCSYVSPEGERCPSTRFLQFHHEQAWGHGGKTTTPNIRILCAAHNQLLAERDFGKERIAQSIATSRVHRN